MRPLCDGSVCRRRDRTDHHLLAWKDASEREHLRLLVAAWNLFSGFFAGPLSTR